MFSHGILIVARNPASRPVVNSSAVASLVGLVLNATTGHCPEAARRRGRCWWREARGLHVPSPSADFEPRDHVSPDGKTAMLLVLTTNRGFGGAGNKWQVAAWRRLDAALGGWRAAHGAHFEVSSTHEQMMLDAAQKGVVSDFERGDMVTLPIAFVLLLVACGRLAVFALPTLLATLLGTFYVLLQIATGAWLCVEGGDGRHGSCPGKPRAHFPEFLPAVLINMIIALSMDYALFLLSRYNSERAAGRPHLTALANTLRSAGRVVLVSGTTLCLCSFGLIASSSGVMRSLAWGGATACAFATTANVTLMPALLFVGGPLLLPPAVQPADFTRFVEEGDAAATVPAAGTSAGRQRGGTAAGSGCSAWSRASLLALCSQGEAASAGGASINHTWVALGRQCQRHRMKILLASVALLLPCAAVASTARVSASQMHLTPIDAAPRRVFERIAAHGISPGLLDPVRVVTINEHAAGPVMGCVDDDFDLRIGVESMLASHTEDALPDPRLRQAPPRTKAPHALR